MKKFLIASLVFISSIVAINSNKFEEVNADTLAVTWDSENLYSTYYALRGTVTYLNTVEAIIFELPTSPYHSYEEGGITASISFYSSPTDPLPLLTLDFVDNFGPDLTARIDIDLEAYGVVGTTYMEVLIPQTYSATPSGYVNGMNEGSYSHFYHTMPYYRETYFKYNHVDNTLTSNKHVVDGGTAYINLSFLDIDYNLTADSLIKYYDSSSVLLDTVGLTEHIDFDKSLINVRLSDGVGYTVDDIALFEVVLDVDPVTSYDFIDDLNNKFAYYFNDGAIMIKFYHAGELWDEYPIIIGDQPFAPATPPDDPVLGVTFHYWALPNGMQYNFTTIRESMVENGVVSLYSFYDVPPIVGTGDLVLPDDTGPDTNAIATGLAHLGFNDPTSRTIIFCFVILSLSGLLIYWKVGYFSIILVNALVSFFFMYLGLVPTFVTVIIVIVFAYLGWDYLKGGGVIRE